MRSILITGSNRGIGLEFVKQFLKLQKPKPEIVIATCRNISAAKELNDLASNDKRLHILEIDVSNFSVYNDFVEKVSAIVGEAGLNVLFNNAGVLLSKDAKLEDMTADFFNTHFVTNSVAPVLLAKSLLPLLKKAANANKSQPLGISRSAIINMSSILGSVSLNTSGKYWGYRESKAALDMSSRTLAEELKGEGISVLMLHPGWVQTDMGGKDATVTTADSVSGLMKPILSLSSETNGSFFDYNGKPVPW